MLLPVDHLIAYEIILDNVLETSVVSQQPQLNDMIAELLPLHSLVPIDVNLLEKIHQSQCQLHP